MLNIKTAQLILLLGIGYSVYATTYYVTVTGADDANRSGTSVTTAWKTLAYACNRVSAGNHEIRLGAGTFIESQGSRPKSGIKIIGNGKNGSQATIIKPSKSWPRTGVPTDFDYNNYLIAIKTWAMGLPARVNNITISNIQFSCDTTHRIDGALFFWDCDVITIHDVSFKDFRCTGMYLAFDSLVDVYNCDITNCNTQCKGSDVFICGQNCDLTGADFTGNIHTRWIKHSRFHEISFTNNIKGNYGVGYKGGGHENVKIYNCTFSGEGFDIESPFEGEYGVEIYGCKLGSPISIPKPGQGEDPNNRGYKYTFRIHDNYMTSSYTVEGPRNHLEIDHNFIQISSNINGRCYSQFGGYTTGPMWIHHNVVENVDRAFIWKGSGQLDSVYVYNNTVYCADAGNRAAPILDSWDNMKGWQVKNNIFVCPSSQPRAIFPSQVASIIKATNNVCFNVTAALSGNYSDQDPQLAFSGTKPFPWYAPAGATSFVVNKGTNVGYPFIGSAPDIGAFEYGAVLARSAQPRINNGTTFWARYDHSNRRIYFPSKVAGLNAVKLYKMDGKSMSQNIFMCNGYIDPKHIANGQYVLKIKDRTGKIFASTIYVQ